MQVHHQLDQLPVFNRAVLTIGSFDGLHRGHQALLKRLIATAAAEGGESVVITFSPHPRKVLRPGMPAPSLLTSLDEKIELFERSGIEHLVIVPFTAEFSALTADEYVISFLVKYFQPARIVIGYDHKFGAGRAGDLAMLTKCGEKYGFLVDEVSAEEVAEIAVSSTRIRAAVRDGDIKTANGLLGYSYPLSGTVVSGRQIGRSIGFPTANLSIDHPDKLLPANGIYAVRARLEDGSRYDGMLYIGSRPSLDDGDATTIECNLFDFSGDLYDRKLRLELVAFIRPDKKMADLEELTKQLRADKQAVTAVLRAPAFTETPELDTAVVVLNYNGRNYLEKFLPPLIASLTENARVVIADNQSTDDSVVWLQENYPDLELIELAENHGFAGGYNQALAQVEADIFVLLNSDVEVTKDWLAPCLSLFAADPEVGACQPKILAQQEKGKFEYAGAAGGWIDSLGYPFCRGRIFTHTEVDKGQHDQVQEVFWATGAALFIRSEVYQGLGGFEAEYFAHAEEIDLCWRLKRAGYKVMAQPASVVYHVGGGTLAYKTPRKTYLNFRNTLTTSFKNEPGIKLFWWLPLRLLLDGLAGVLFLIQGDWPHILAIVRAHWHVYPRLRFWYRRRKLRKQQIESMRIGPDRTEIGCLSDSVVFHYYLLGHQRFDQIVRPQIQILAEQTSA